MRMSLADVEIKRSTAPSRRREAASIVQRVVDRLAAGNLRSRPFAVRFWDGSELPATAAPPTAASPTAALSSSAPGRPSAPGRASAVRATPPTILVTDPAAIAHIVREPNELGLARAWGLGLIDLAGDLDDAFSIGERLPKLRISARDRLDALRAAWQLVGAGGLIGGLPMPAGELRARRGALHSKSRDRDSVRHHYDVPTDFHRLVIGPSMVYSCAYFSEPTDTLEAAQERKLEVICRKLRLEPGMRLLDVGCGWGSLVLHAAREHGVNAVGVTLSEPQAREARERIRQAGGDLASRCEIRVADYREVDDGPYDAVASVGMYEHVGLDKLDEYTATISRLLRPGGLFLNHGIARLRQPQRRSAFIDRFIFPDGELHPVGNLIRSLESQRLEVRDVEALREHYGLTLRRWIANLSSNREQAIAIAGSERERIWQVYLTGSARAFERGMLSIFQVLCARPGAAHTLPLARWRLV
jgi:cyclopropane-fatty-acyl-phospholipid synthase